MPGPLTSSLEAALTAGPPPAPGSGRARSGPVTPPYPDTGLPPRHGLGGGWQLTSLWPESGRFAAIPTTSPPGPLTVDYQYGFSVSGRRRTV